MPLKSPYGVNVATPVYGAARIFYTTPYVYGTCYPLQPGPKGPQPEKAWDTTLDTCTGTVLFVDGLLYGSGYKKHKSWLCLDWKSGRDSLRVEGPDDRGGRVCGWAAVLPGRGRPGSAAAADARAVRDRRPVPARAERGRRRLGTPGSAPRQAVPPLSRYALVLRCQDLDKRDPRP